MTALNINNIPFEERYPYTLEEKDVTDRVADTARSVMKKMLTRHAIEDQSFSSFKETRFYKTVQAIVYAEILHTKQYPLAIIARQWEGINFDTTICVRSYLDDSFSPKYLSLLPTYVSICAAFLSATPSQNEEVIELILKELSSKGEIYKGLEVLTLIENPQLRACHLDCFKRQLEQASAFEHLRKAYKDLNERTLDKALEVLDSVSSLDFEEKDEKETLLEMVSNAYIRLGLIEKARFARN